MEIDHPTYLYASNAIYPNKLVCWLLRCNKGFPTTRTVEGRSRVVVEVWNCSYDNMGETKRVLTCILRMECIVLLVFLLLLRVSNGIKDIDKLDKSVPAMYVMGDSLGDAGNNNYINTRARANYPPNGESFFHFPTGRFCDGRIVYDFLAMKLNLPFPPPYLQPGANLSVGACFASGGSGILNSTHVTENVISFGSQVDFLSQHASQLEEELGQNESKEFLANSLFFSVTGSNDVGCYLEDRTISVTEFFHLLITTYTQYLKRIYEIGARKIVVIDVGAVGCTPAARASILEKDENGCSALLNHIAHLYNKELRVLLNSLNSQLEGALFVFCDVFNYTMDVINDPASYGMLETHAACCGSGELNAVGECNYLNEEMVLCGDPEDYLFWDKAHPTEKFYWLISQQFWDGDDSFISPVNVKTLFMNSMVKPWVKNSAEISKASYY